MHVYICIFRENTCIFNITAAYICIHIVFPAFTLRQKCPNQIQTSLARLLLDSQARWSGKGACGKASAHRTVEKTGHRVLYKLRFGIHHCNLYIYIYIYILHTLRAIIFWSLLHEHMLVFIHQSCSTNIGRTCCKITKACRANTSGR